MFTKAVDFIKKKGNIETLLQLLKFDTMSGWVPQSNTFESYLLMQ